MFRIPVAGMEHVQVMFALAWHVNVEHAEFRMARLARSLR